MQGPFVHLEFPADNDPDVIFIENTIGDTLFRDDEELTRELLAKTVLGSSRT
jgi:Cft2 family RNA processing exonuclease